MAEVIISIVQDENRQNITMQPALAEALGNNEAWYDELADRVIETCRNVAAEYDGRDGDVPVDMSPYLNINAKYGLEDDCVGVVVHPTDELVAMYETEKDEAELDELWEMIDEIKIDVDGILSDFNRHAKRVFLSDAKSEIEREAITKEFTINVSSSTDAGVMISLQQNRGINRIYDKLDEEQFEKFSKIMTGYINEVHVLTEKMLNNLDEEFEED